MLPAAHPTKIYLGHREDREERAMLMREFLRLELQRLSHVAWLVALETAE
jgi:hypothetical protein